MKIATVTLLTQGNLMRPRLCTGIMSLPCEYRNYFFNHLYTFFCPPPLVVQLAAKLISIQIVSAWMWITHLQAVNSLRALMIEL